ncbi:MAG: ATP-binding protein [Saprospiraceae bacterium]|nr:ATP-binding protein [Saprospiraceae bacterium]
MKALINRIFEFKNLSAHSISIVSAAILTLFGATWYVTANLVEGHALHVGFLLAIVVTTAGFSYILIRTILEKYIYRRIKLIYKTIRKAKVSMPQKSLDLSESSVLDQVEEEVAEWAEEREREINTLKTLEQYRKRFLGNVSHELKTPIFSIQGYIHTLLDGGLRDETVNEKYLARAASNVERLLTIVQDLEAISKLESGELILEIQEFDIKDLVHEVFADVEIKAKEKDIQLKFKEGAERSFMVKGDREYIRQVFNNLIVNSIKYGREGGVTKVSFYDMDRQVLIEVSDDGIGIAEKHLNHLFDRFYRVDKSRSRVLGGSGLGLSIVKHILEAHNQTINVRSTPDVGSTFGFTLDKA